MVYNIREIYPKNEFKDNGLVNGNVQSKGYSL
jgi:hypothetical protein